MLEPARRAAERLEIPVRVGKPLPHVAVTCREVRPIVRMHQRLAFQASAIV